VPVAAPRTILLTAIAMIAFAANSVLCRLALGPQLVDAASYTTLRAISGALVLWLMVKLRSGDAAPDRASLRTAAMLFGYMIFFSFAYALLSTGAGALILFGAVQLTMFTGGLRSGEHFSLVSWAGLALAVLGLVYLVSPGVMAPDPLGALLMALSGICWGVYSLVGRGMGNPVNTTAKSFIGAVPLALAVSLVSVGNISADPAGLALAVASGALTSAGGYIIWFAALPGLTATGAATVQLVVPAIAACGGVLLLSEPVTLRLVLASAATLGGVGIVLAQRERKTPAR
jgi:drug/metabolite transporter (DMT)-like permease